MTLRRAATLFAAILILLPSCGCVRKNLQQHELLRIFWGIEDARIEARRCFEDNYYRSEDARRRAGVRLRERLDELDDIGMTLEEIQERNKPQTDELVSLLQDMQSEAADILEMYIYEISPRPLPRLAAVKDAERSILEMYLPNRDSAARRLHIPKRKT